MSNHAIEQSTLEVGTPLMTREQIDSLPVGAVIGPDTRDTYTRVAEGWRRDNSGRVTGPDRYFALLGYNKILELPSPRVGQIVGDHVSAASLPVGTEVRAPTGLTYEKAGENHWTRPGLRIQRTDALIERRLMEIIALPEPVTLPAWMRVGYRLLTREEIAALPVGTVIAVHSSGIDPHTRIEEGWVPEGGDIRGDDWFALNGHCSIVSLPGSESSEPDTVVVTGTAPFKPGPRNYTGTLRFVEAGEEYSTYLTVDDEEVYLAHGTNKRLVTFDSIAGDLDNLWSEFRTTLPRYTWDGPLKFGDHLREMLTDPEEVEEQMRFCPRCSIPYLREAMHPTNLHSDPACGDCIDNYYTCVRCEELFPDTTTDLYDNEVCESCRDYYWSWCGDCDGYYPRDSDEDHGHNDCEDACESPWAARTFSIRNDGDGPLANDTPATVTLPAGVISEEGLTEIRRFVQNWAYGEYPSSTTEDGDMRSKFYKLAARLPELGDRWQAKDGNYTKRLSRLAYKEFGLKVPPPVISRVGNIASDHSREIDFVVEVTRELNLPREDFVHEDSCWWTDYYQSRCALKTNGGFGLRTFRGTRYGDEPCPRGRAWVMPLRKNERGVLVPTFDTENPDAFVAFNGYGDLEGYAPARLLSHMVGMTYRKIEFGASPMYVNNGSAYLVAPEEIANQYTDKSLYLDTPQHSTLFETETERVLANV